MGPADSRRISRVPRYSGYRYARLGFVYRTLTVYGRFLQSVPHAAPMQRRGPTTPLMPRDTRGLGSSPFARHYWGNH